MNKIASIVLLASGLSMANLNPSIVDNTPSTYAQQNLANMTIGSWWTKTGTNDIVFYTTEYQMGFLIPGSEKTTQTAFLMAVQTNRTINFYVESIHASGGWSLNSYGLINNFGVNF